MNEQIKQLEKQCWSHRVDGALVDGQLHFDTQKFAELIIRECAGIVRNSRLPDAYSEPCLQDIADDIEEHFGVAE